MKKKILLLGDDLRLHSGIGTMSREIVFGTLHKYDWFQIGGAIKHPEANKGILDLSKDPEVLRSVKSDNIYLKVLPTDGYGNADIVRDIIRIEKPDAIMHFTDPRFWDFLYDMEHEIRTKMPLMYYNIWDDLPFPHWNEPFYDCCDLLMAISKQTYNINKHVCITYPRIEGKDLTYVPHGIDPSEYYNLSEEERKSEEFVDFKKQVLSGNDYDFVAMFNSRNIRRKSPADLIQAFSQFVANNDAYGKTALILHTDIVDQNGTDLMAVKTALADKCHVIFSTSKMDSKFLNYMYNIADVVCCPSSAEGFGLSHMEALMSGTPTITTVVGGLQDQMGFKVDGKELTVDH